MSLTPDMQRAAVEVALRDGKSLADIRKHHPDLAEGADLVEAEQKRQKAPKRSGHGSMSIKTVRPRSFG